MTEGRYYFAAWKDAYGTPRAWGVADTKASAVQEATVQLELYRRDKAAVGVTIDADRFSIAVIQLPGIPASNLETGRVEVTS